MLRTVSIPGSKNGDAALTWGPIQCLTMLIENICFYVCLDGFSLVPAGLLLAVILILSLLLSRAG